MNHFSKVVSSLVICYLLAGCATAPSSRMSIPTYTIDGVNYVPLVSLCEQRGIKWGYDIFTKTITLEKDSQRIILMVGENIALVNGSEKDLRSPVDTYRGIVVLPRQFKEQVIDALFKDYSQPQQPRPASISTIKTIIIDAGHGGHDPGAIGKSGLREKDVVLDIARRLAHYLEAEGKTVILTRSTDNFVTLAQRVKLANRNDADLFVSIHANANRSRSQSGFEVYCLSDSVDDTARALTFVKENPNIKISNASFYDSSPELKAIVWDMIYTSNRQESLELAKHISRRVSTNLDIKTNGSKGGPYYVLKWTKMPAVLIEVGYLSNQAEEKMLKNSFYRQQIAEQIASGILSYCQQLTPLRGQAMAER